MSWQTVSMCPRSSSPGYSTLANSLSATFTRPSSSRNPASPGVSLSRSMSPSRMAARGGLGVGAIEGDYWQQWASFGRDR